MKRFNPKIPILMYHEIVSDCSKTKIPIMTPHYCILNSMFENQLDFLAINGYKSLLFEDVPLIKEEGKYIILTFDDGMEGNFKYALPALRKYNYKAVIFVAVEMIGTKYFMSWADIKEMSACGMSIQSHTMTHRPLQALSDNDVYKELEMSKKMIEDRLGTTVSALSFPHGSYNTNVLSIAHEIGYKYVCTSNIECVYLNSFRKAIPVLGRLTISRNQDLKRFINILEYNKYVIMKEDMAKVLKNILKKLIGIENYRKLYRKYFKIQISSL